MIIIWDTDVSLSIIMFVLILLCTYRFKNRTWYTDVAYNMIIR